MMNNVNILVIGVGSPFGADRFGWQVIEELETRGDLACDEIRLESSDRPGTLLLDYMQGVRKAILIDAITGGTPGNVRIIDKTQLIEQSSIHSAHQFGVAETISLGETLNLLPDEIILIGVETGNKPDQYLPSTNTLHKAVDLVLENTKQ